MDITFFWLPYARTLKKNIPKIKLKLFKFYQNLPISGHNSSGKIFPKNMVTSLDKKFRWN